jgi:hypothetical protein
MTLYCTRILLHLIRTSQFYEMTKNALSELA